MADIYNTASNTLLSGTSGDDYIQNGGYRDGSWHNSGGSNVTIIGGADNDTIYNDYDGEWVTIDGGAGDDSILQLLGRARHNQSGRG